MIRTGRQATSPHPFQPQHKDLTMKFVFAARRLIPSAALLACLGMAAPAAFGQAFDVVRNFGAAPGEDGRWIGIAFVAGRAYPGSNEARNLLLPQLEYQWSNGWFAGTSNGIGYNFSKNPALDYGVRITADLGRSESRSPALNGMGNIDASPEVGAFLNYSLSREFVLTSSFRYGAGNDHNGALLLVGGTYSTAVAPNWRVGAGVSLNWANAAYMQSYFGVTDAQSATSGYAPYSPGAGLRDVRVSASATYIMSPRMVVTAGVSYDSLQAGARDSVLAVQPSYFSGVVALTYGF